MAGKVLIVDDDISVCEFFFDTLSECGYEVLSSGSGEGAIEILEKTDIKVIFLDLRLFGMNGIELCRKIRDSKPLSIIYAVTGWAPLFEIQECRLAGFDDCFTKPVSLELIFKAVDDAFEKNDRWKNHYGKTGAA